MCTKKDIDPLLLFQIKTKFYNIRRFANVVGVIDGTHIKIVAPSEYEASYVNRKGQVSIGYICVMLLGIITYIADHM